MVDSPPLATVADLQQVLAGRPVLWVGAGASMAAGFPGTGDLVRAMATAASNPLDTKQPFEQVADAFVAANSAAELDDLLQRMIGRSRPLTPLHRALARAAAEDRLAAIVTTNYDDLLERALADAEVDYVQQDLEANASVVDPAAQLRLFKLHGSRTDWRKVILSGDSYATFHRRHPLLRKQLDVLLHQHPVLFVGCSLQDPRILQWLEELDDDATERLKSWSALLTEGEWKAALEKGGDALGRAPLRPLILEDHAHLPRLWSQAVPERPKPGEAVITLELGTLGPGGAAGSGWSGATTATPQRGSPTTCCWRRSGSPWTNRLWAQRAVEHLCAGGDGDGAFPAARPREHLGRCTVLPAPMKPCFSCCTPMRRS